MRAIAFRLYLLFTLSWFLHLPSRIPPLGLVRFDLFLIASIAAMIALSRPEKKVAVTGRTHTMLKLIFLWVFITLPLVEWPGSVVRHGLPNFIKSVVFFYFTVALLTSQKRLRTFMFVFIGVQTFRVFEPVILHVTTGYWGSMAHMSNWDFMNRLSGAPYDVINPNGLAFIIVSIFPFFHFFSRLSGRNRLIYLIVAPVLLYALVLTGSRTGLVAFMIVAAGIWLKSKRKAFLTVVFAFGAVVAISQMSGTIRDRYMSLFSSESLHEETADGRIEGMKQDFRVALRKPIVGHGLGTSVEANANYGGYGKISHVLYAEVAQELGFVGLFIFLLFIGSLIKNFTVSLKRLRAESRNHGYLTEMANAMQVWVVMNVIASLASYGLSSYEWYLFGGLSIVIRKLATEAAEEGVGVKVPGLSRNPAWSPAALYS